MTRPYRTHPHDRTLALPKKVRRLRSRRSIVIGTFVVATAWTAGGAAADVTIDRSNTHQTIEGFGLFGGADVWWSSASAVLDQAWTQRVIDDLGITMWRNEYYPNATAQAPQDADWSKQKPVVQSLVDYAHLKGVDLKILLTVWSPPASDKCLVADEGVPDWGTCATPLTRPADTKGGNILDRARVTQFRDWLIAGLRMYHDDIGHDVYGLSFQNEPYFWEPYNSCFYAQPYYAETLKAIGPAIKAAFPGVRLFGAENMLGIECGAGSSGTNFDPYWYTGAILDDAAALALIDAWAVHGYVDGVSATATSKLATLWTSFRTGTASAGKPVWMTETSGYTHTWPGTAASPGPLDLAQAIYAALAFGNLTAWTYWQGSEKDGCSEYSLMTGASPCKNYYIAKQYYRFVRPGAQRVTVTSNDPEVMVVAFQHPTMNTLTVVAINTGTSSKPLNFLGSNLPTSYDAFRTSETENAVALGSLAVSGLSLPASSITTFVNGTYIETPSTDPGTGGAPSAGGTSATGGARTGGAPSMGGTSATGGARTGGAPSMGGTRAATGGSQGAGAASTSATGGRVTSGGTTTTGATPTSGGLGGTGGHSATSGAHVSGGGVATGGVLGASGFAGLGGTAGGSATNTTGESGASSGTAAATGGASALITGTFAAGTSASDSAPPGNAIDEGGCSCSVVGNNPSRGFLVLLGGTALLGLRRRRR